MNEITSSQVKKSIREFIEARLATQLAKKQKELEVAEQKSDTQAIEKVLEDTNKLHDKYRVDEWVADAALKHTKGLKFGTHISKGVHPDSQGSSIRLEANRLLPEYLIASQSANNLMTDLEASGNAASLPLAAFFAMQVTPEYKLRDLLIENHPSLKGCFHQDATLSDQFQTQFIDALNGQIDEPQADERNKQVLWPMSDNAHLDDAYMNLVVLHPSSFAHAVYNKVQNTRFSDENLEARKNRSKQNVEQKPYKTISDLAVIKLGGSNTQNVGQLNNRQGGRCLLFSSLPPLFARVEDFSLKDSEQTIFNRRLKFSCRQAFNELKTVTKYRKNRVQEREMRDEALSQILQSILLISVEFQNRTPGWSKSSKLALEEKYWLDPNRSSLTGEEKFSMNRDSSDWKELIAAKFSLWLARWLREEAKVLETAINDAEIALFKKEMHSVLRDIT